MTDEAVRQVEADRELRDAYERLVDADRTMQDIAERSAERAIDWGETFDRIALWTVPPVRWWITRYRRQVVDRWWALYREAQEARASVQRAFGNP